MLTILKLKGTLDLTVGRKEDNVWSILLEKKKFSQEYIEATYEIICEIPHFPPK